MIINHAGVLPEHLYFELVTFRKCWQSNDSSFDYIISVSPCDLHCYRMLHFSTKGLANMDQSESHLYA